VEDKLHWSCDDGLLLSKKVFPEGFSAQNSTLPNTKFNPDSDWHNSYDLVNTGFQFIDNDAAVYYGSLHIAAKFENDQVKLTASGTRQFNQSFTAERQHFQSESVCKLDEQFSLKEDTVWKVKNELKNQHDPATHPYSQINESGKISAGCIKKTDSAGKWYSYQQAKSKQVVSDWALCASAGRLNRKKQYKFDYLQQLQRLSCGHTIRFLESFDARFGRRNITLHGYVQTGPAITPCFYWVDDHGRLIMARFALSAIVYNPQPRIERAIGHG
jgi:hypothetical protein